MRGVTIGTLVSVSLFCNISHHNVVGYEYISWLACIGYITIMIITSIYIALCATPVQRSKRHVIKDPCICECVCMLLMHPDYDEHDK